MGDQQLYKTNHVAHGGENLFYQQPPLGVHGGLNHSYGNTVPGAGMDAPQASPISPHFPGMPVFSPAVSVWLLSLSLVSFCVSALSLDLTTTLCVPV